MGKVNLKGKRLFQESVVNKKNIDENVAKSIDDENQMVDSNVVVENEVVDNVFVDNQMVIDKTCFKWGSFK